MSARLAEPGVSESTKTATVLGANRTSRQWRLSDDSGWQWERLDNAMTISPFNEADVQLKWKSELASMSGNELHRPSKLRVEREMTGQPALVVQE